MKIKGTYQQARELNRDLAKFKGNKQRFRYDGMGYIILEEKLKKSKPERMNIGEVATINRDLRRYGGHPHDVGR